MNSKPFQVGITGGIGSGKSLVCKIFSSLGVPIYDADTRAKWLMDNDSIIKQKVKESFGENSYDSKGLNRAYLAKTVFVDQEKLSVLNQIVHPAVGQDYREWVQKQEADVVIKEAALMFESDAYKTLDKIINVSAPAELRIKRVLKRDSQRGRDQIEAIIAKQLPEEERISRSDYVIYNDGNQLVIPQVLKLHQHFLKAAKKEN